MTDPQKLIADFNRAGREFVEAIAPAVRHMSVTLKEFGEAMAKCGVVADKNARRR